MKNIYLDASATTPPHIDVINKLQDIQSECWGNPSSIHKVGVIARDILERSRLSIATKLKASSVLIVFTSEYASCTNVCADLIAIICFLFQN